MSKQIRSEKNEVVYVKIKGEDGFLYECVGVLMKDDLKYIKIAFNAHDDVVKDDIVIQKNQIIDLFTLDEKKLKSCK